MPCRRACRPWHSRASRTSASTSPLQTNTQTATQTGMPMATPGPSAGARRGRIRRPSPRCRGCAGSTARLTKTRCAWSSRWETAGCHTCPETRWASTRPTPNRWWRSCWRRRGGWTAARQCQCRATTTRRTVPTRRQRARRWRCERRLPSALTFGSLARTACSRRSRLRAPTPQRSHTPTMRARATWRAVTSQTSSGRCCRAVHRSPPARCWLRCVRCSRAFTPSLRARWKTQRRCRRRLQRSSTRHTVSTASASAPLL
mmetsp:Transcript_33019/g.98281  ORF Transcript_33019/g.98281 Transcript_33019/m.98281 type:complete len:259 (+) Transcript_33019:1033-1809(+)